MDIPTKVEKLEESLYVINDMLNKSFDKIDLLEKEISILMNYKKDSERSRFMDNLEKYYTNQEVNVENIIIDRSINVTPPPIERQNAFILT
tara:strand:- start:847 stop:1119 length:273 start_codon:yes stop_codon:yes gene_type:complete